MTITPKEAVAAAKNYDEGTLKRYIRQEYCSALHRLVEEVRESGSKEAIQALAVLEAIERSSAAILTLVGLEAKRRRLTMMLTSSFGPQDVNAREELAAQLTKIEQKLSPKTFSDLFSLEVFGGSPPHQPVSQTTMSALSVSFQWVAEVLSAPQQVLTVGKGEPVHNNYNKSTSPPTTTTLLHLAAYAGAAESVDLLLSFGANPNAVEAEYQLFASSETAGPISSLSSPKRSLTSMSQSLLASPLSPTVLERTLMSSGDTLLGNMVGKTPLHWAAFEGHTDICRDLLSVKAEERMGKNSSASSPFCTSQFAWLPLAVIEANPVPMDANGQTPCHVAIVNGKFETAQIFPNYEACIRQRKTESASINIDKVASTGSGLQTAGAKEEMIDDDKHVGATSVITTSLLSMNSTSSTVAIRNTAPNPVSQQLTVQFPPAKQIAGRDGFADAERGVAMHTSATLVGGIQNIPANPGNTSQHDAEPRNALNHPTRAEAPSSIITFEMDEEERELRKMILRETLQRKAEKRSQREEKHRQKLQKESKQEDSQTRRQRTKEEDLLILKDLIAAINNASDAIRTLSTQQDATTSRHLLNKVNASVVKEANSSNQKHLSSYSSNSNVQTVNRRNTTPFCHASSSQEAPLHDSIYNANTPHYTLGIYEGHVSQSDGYYYASNRDPNIISSGTHGGVPLSSQSTYTVRHDEGNALRIAQGTWAITGSTSTSLRYE